mmetsp:Transcript_3149/g.11308  ORF Transcript_3149/g.11308 Transcript_3149/m.11308 type:complete len:249 (-) Transcript_3149:4174-4920(-)
MLLLPRQFLETSSARRLRSRQAHRLQHRRRSMLHNNLCNVASSRSKHCRPQKHDGQPEVGFEDNDSGADGYIPSDALTGNERHGRRGGRRLQIQQCGERVGPDEFVQPSDPVDLQHRQQELQVGGTAPTANALWARELQHGHSDDDTRDEDAGQHDQCQRLGAVTAADTRSVARATVASDAYLAQRAAVSKRARCAVRPVRLIHVRTSRGRQGETGHAAVVRSQARDKARRVRVSAPPAWHVSHLGEH